MSLCEERQARRKTIMLKHRKKTGGFVPAGHSRLRSLYARCRIDPALDIFLFKPKKRKVK
tara:strand:+ start:122 stop:301 length:180 start_codon:yes stop_codon:yes gene_type:complete